MKYASALRGAVLLALFVVVQNVSAVERIRVVDLFGNPNRGQRVVLEGRFIETVNFETMLFGDETGQIEVVIAEGNMLPERLTSAAYKVRLQGETDSGYLGKPLLLFENVEVISHDPELVVTTAKAASERQVHETSLQEKADCKDHVPGKSTDDISSLLDNRCIGTQVTLVGVFVGRINYETLLFRDQSGEIEVVVDDDDMLLINHDAWTRQAKLQGELTRGYRQQVLVEFESIAPLKQG